METKKHTCIWCGEPLSGKGILGQIEHFRKCKFIPERPDLKYTGPITMDNILGAIKEFEKQKAEKNPNLKQPVEEKLLSGYMYRATPKKGGVILNTGVGGAKEMVSAFRGVGMDEASIQENIQVFTDEQGWVRLSDLTVKKKEHDKGTSTTE